ncbi:MAG TPA: hypothetical protein VKN99_16475 [Polyangia bacterium]|nr:hypothetical protein [Polyangia bacterium]
MLVVPGATGCVLPESLDVVSDVEVNYRPVVVEADPSTEKTVTMPVGAAREFSLKIEDLNIGDGLFVRFFVDFDAAHPTPAIQEEDWPAPVNPPPGDFVRSLTPEMFQCGVALFPPPQSGMHVLSAFVSDRRYINDGSSVRRLPADAKTSEIAWLVVCP